MPTAIKHRRNTPKARKRVFAGKAKQKPGRERSVRSASPAPRVIADSVFALTLAPKSGIEVMHKQSTKRAHYHDATDDYQQMYMDLLQCVQNGIKVLTGQVTTFDPLASGLEIGTSMGYIIKAFEGSILPKGFSYNIDRNDQGYYFTVYDTCDFPEYWHAFEIKPIVLKLAKSNPKLHSLFLQVIRCLDVKAQIPTWWNGGMGYSEYGVEDRIANWEDGFDDESEEEMKSGLDKALDEIECYKSGDAYRYENLIKKAPYRKPEAILKSLTRFSSKSGIVKWMIAACEFLKNNGSMCDFCYPEMSDEVEGLMFDQQTCIIWDLKDIYSDMQMECLDAEAQGCGIHPPIINRVVMTFSKDLDFEEMKERAKWPGKLHDLWVQYDALIK